MELSQKFLPSQPRRKELKVKILILGLICLCLFSCEKGIENPYSPNPTEIEEITKTQITFTFNYAACCCGKYPPELEELAWYQIFEIYINDGLGTYGDGLLIHTHEFGRGGGYYYELPKRTTEGYSFIPDLWFYGTRTPLPGAYERNTEFDYEVWFYLKESNIPPELIHKVKPRILIDLAPLEQGFDFGDISRLDSFCFDWEVGERTVSSPDHYFNILVFRVMIVD